MLPTVSMVIPALNEERSIPHVFARIPEDIHQVILVDGGSVDNTVGVARQIRSEVCVVPQSRKGKGNALACGFEAATGDVIAMLDADGSADPTEIPRFVAALVDGADFAKGARFSLGGGSNDIARLRRLGNTFLTTFFNICYGSKYSDLCYGYNVFWRQHVPVLGLDASSPPRTDGPPIRGDVFEVETLIHAHVAKAGLSVAEVPSYEYSRIHGVSNLNAARDGLRVVRTIVAEWVSRRHHEMKPPMLPSDRGVCSNGRTGRMTAEGQSSSAIRVMVIGSGWHFTSGISHYTYRLSTALGDRCPTSALLMRRLVPRRMYPGASRVGADVTDADYPAHVPVYDGVDWYWGRSLARALKFLDRERPDVVILQWWTGAVLHTYLCLARHAARRGAHVILEWHEGQDVGEAAMPGARRYVRTLMPRLLRHVAAHVVHSGFDLRAITAAYSLGGVPVRVIPHGPYDHLARPVAARPTSLSEPLRLLYLGVVRPFKGVEDLVEAFSGLEREQAAQFRLVVVGETWERWTEPDEAIARSPHADLIERVDRYVTDAELTEYFGQADAAVFPYHRSSASGPLHIAMSAGLPVVVTAVGGLVEAARDYRGADMVPPRDPAALRSALLRLLDRRGDRYADPHSWDRTVDSFGSLIDELRGRAPSGQTSWHASLSAAGADQQ